MGKQKTDDNSVQFSHSIVSDSLRPHESQHAMPPCTSPAPGVYSNSTHRVGDAIQPSHPLLSSSPPAPNPSQHQSLFQWVNSLYEVAKVLEFQLQHQSFQWTHRTDLLMTIITVQIAILNPISRSEPFLIPKCFLLKERQRLFEK